MRNFPCEQTTITSLFKVQETSSQSSLVTRCHIIHSHVAPYWSCLIFEWRNEDKEDDRP